MATLDFGYYNKQDANDPINKQIKNEISQNLEKYVKLTKEKGRLDSENWLIYETQIQDRRVHFGYNEKDGLLDAMVIPKHPKF